MSKSLEKLPCSVYTIYVNMNGNEVLPRLLPKPLLLMTSVFEQGHWLFLCDVLCADILMMKFKKNIFVVFKVLATSLCCSVVMGLISFAFLKCLDYAADFRSFFPLCYIFLPVAGIVTAFVYKRIGGKSSMGNNIIIESANDGEKVPKRLASLTFIFTCITHLFGGSVGREGTAVQIGGSLTSNVADYLGFKNNDRSTIVLSGISSAFGSVIGTPIASAYIGLEV